MMCGYGWSELFVGALGGIVATAGLMLWFFDYCTSPLEDEFEPSFMELDDDE